MKKDRILFLGAGPAFTRSIVFQDKYLRLSSVYSGDIITPVPGVDYLDLTRVGYFDIHPFLYYRGSSILRNVYSCFHTVLRALKIHYLGRRYRVVISPNPLLTGLTALFIAKITGAKSIIEVNGNFESAFKFSRLGRKKANRAEKIKDKLSRPLIKSTLKWADMVKLTYRDQLKPLKMCDEDRITRICFPNYVPIRTFIESEKHDGRYILLLGFPWYLKGVDILIKAFHKISPYYPDMRLKVVGWCPDGREYFESLTAGDPRIELLEPVHYEQVIPLMTGCTMYVLASRTDSSPRVLREAMASQKPIIAANVDGVPDLIRDGYNGLLFEMENVDDLAEKILVLLENHELGRSLGQNGLFHVQKHLSEDRYINSFQDMIERTLGDS